MSYGSKSAVLFDANGNPISLIGLKSSATAVVPAETASLANGVAGAGVPGAAIMAWDGTAYRRLSSMSSGGIYGLALGALNPGVDANTNAGVSTPTPNSFATGAAPFLFNGSTWDRLRNNAAAVLAAATQPFGSLVAEPGEWTVDSPVAAAGTPSASKAAGAAGVRHVARNLSISLTNTGAASVLVTIALRDGASGAGTIKRTWQFVVPAAGTINVDPAGLNILGSAATAMTLEATAALPATVSGVCSLAGYSTI